MEYFGSTGKPGDKEWLALASNALKERLPDGYGFILMAMPFGTGKGRLYYCSDLDRESAIKVVKEWLFQVGSEENWMKHIK